MGLASADGVAMEGGGRGCCCGPQAFTSGVLGALACLLVTGGVFLAFHRWDPLWLVVSAVGALLALVGSLLHCCAEQQRPAPSHKGGASAPLHQQGPAMLPEQLVPLSNARSVSQLSLNMLPGYFPPVVAAYGIEQHSAVVQNIVGQQQQRGARLLVLSLPDHTPQASLHSLVAAVYQLDGNVLTEIPSIPENNTAPPAVPPVVLQPSQPVFKHVEVQTTTAWPTPSQPSTSLNLLDCSAPICDTLPPADQVLVPLRQEALVSTRAPPDAQPEVRPSNTRVSSGTTEVSRSSVSTETQVSPTSSVSTNTQMLPTSSVSSNTQVLPKSSRSSFSRGTSDGGRRSSAGTRRSSRAEARRPSAPADMQAPSASTSISEPTTVEQIPTRSDNQTSPTTIVPRRVTDAETHGISQDSHTASRSSDVPSYSSAMRDEMPSNSADTQRISNTNAQESARTSNARERSGTRTETPTAVQTSPRPPEVPDCSIRMPEIPASQRNESSVTVSIPQEVEVQVPSEVQASAGPDASQDNATPIHCQAPANNVLVEISSDSTPSASTSSSSSVLIDIPESEAIPSTSTGLNSERLLDESLLGAVGGASSELSLSDLDEAELMERSSPPPSYDDVTHERDGSFALAYGTI